MSEQSLQRWQQIKEIFFTAIEMTPKQRQKFLTEACQKDSELRQEIESLLHNHESSGTLIIDAPVNEIAFNLLQNQSISAISCNLIEQDFNGTNRFKIQNQLGSGGFGVVYKAIDLELNTVVAIKVLRENKSTSLYRFKQEFRSLANLLHPNLVKLYELLSDNNYWILVMEMVEGINLIDYVVGDLYSQENSNNSQENILTGITHPLQYQRLKIALKQLVEGLSVLHKAGKIHRDVKPSNIIVTQDHRLVVLDFGLVLELSLEQSLGVVGTPSYMSPEQCDSNKTITAASDWYSVGVILYKILTGQLPFSGNFLQIMNQKVTLDPPKPSLINPTIPKELEELCLALLDKIPENRPSGKEILYYLATSQDKGNFLDVINKSVNLSDRNSSNFVGRQEYIDTFWKHFYATQTGKGVSVYVQGKSGVGKSALIRHFLQQVQTKYFNAVILTGRCYERESVPYKALDSLIDELSKYLKKLSLMEAEVLLPRDVLALAKLFPVMQQVEAIEKAKRRNVTIPNSQELRRRAFASLRELLARLAETKPLILFIDDLQWGDIDSAALLSELLLPPDPPAMLLIGCYRSDEAETNSFLSTLFSFLNQHYLQTSPVSELDFINVEEFSLAEAECLASKLLAEQQNNSLTLAKSIAQESNGNPFFIYELVRSTSSDYALLLENQKNDLENYSLHLEEVLWHRIKQLSLIEQEFLMLVAIAGQPIKPKIVKMAANLNISEQELLVKLSAEHLIKISGTVLEQKLEVYHDKIRETILSKISEENLKEKYLQLANTLETLTSSDFEALVVYYKGAKDYEKAAKYAVIAAEKAASSLAFDHAARLYQWALDVRKEGQLSLKVNKSSQKQTLRNKLAEVLVNAGRNLDAAQVYLDTAQGAIATERLELEYNAAEQWLRSGQIKQAKAFITILLKQLCINPNRFIETVFLKSFYKLKDFLESKQLIKTSNQTASPEKLLAIDVCWLMSFIFGLIDPNQGQKFQSHGLVLAFKANDPYHIVRATIGETLYSAFLGSRNSKKTKKLLQKSLILAEKLNNPYALSLAAMVNGLSAYFASDWHRASNLLEKAEDIFRERCTGAVWEINTIKLFFLRTLFYIGEIPKIVKILQILLKDSEERNDFYVEINIKVSLLYIIYIVNDEPEKAYQEINDILRSWKEEGFYIQHLFASLAKMQLLLYQEDINTLEKELDQTLTPINTFLHLQTFFIEILFLQAKVALQKNHLSPQKNNLSFVKRTINKLRQENNAWANILAKLLQASLANFQKDNNQALNFLESAERELKAEQIWLYVKVTQRQKGELLTTLGNQIEGSTFIRDADLWLNQQGIKNPKKIANMLVPLFL